MDQYYYHYPVRTAGLSAFTVKILQIALRRSYAPGMVRWNHVDTKLNFISVLNNIMYKIMINMGFKRYQPRRVWLYIKLIFKVRKVNFFCQFTQNIE